MLIVTVQPAWQTRQGCRCQNQRIFTPTHIPWGEKACPGLLSQPCRAAHHLPPQPCPPWGDKPRASWHQPLFSPQLMRSRQTPSSRSPPVAAFKQKSPRNHPGAVQPQPWLLGSRWEPAGHLQSPCHRPALPAVPSLAAQLPAHGKDWRKGVEKTKLLTSAGARFPLAPRGSHGIRCVEPAGSFHQLPCDFALGIF